MPMNKREVGTHYEEMALSYLQKQGHKVLYKNYRIRSGEIDLITKDENYIVFTEVKYRTNLRNGYGYEAVNLKKQKVIIRTAMHYLLTHGYGEDTAVRFDVISILGEEITHIKNAFGA